MRLSLQFEPISMEHREAACDILCKEQFGSSESSFQSLFLWGEVHGTQVAIEDGFLFVRVGEGSRARYLFPYGAGNLCAALEAIEADALQNGASVLLIGVTDRMRERMESVCPGRYKYEATRDFYDYIYHAHELIELPGKKFHAKRNHVNKFMGQYAEHFQYERIDAGNLEEVQSFQQNWVEENKTVENEKGLLAEQCVISRAIKNYHTLGVQGGLIRIDGAVAAYSMGTRLCSESFLVEIEKGDIRYPGIYQVMNQQFATHNCQEVRYINREDDTGAEGLRRAKLSYQPAFLLRKYRATPKEG